MERVLGKDMFDVGDEQLLMLLLVMNAENQDRFDFIQKLFVGLGNEIVDMFINGRTITMGFVNCRARDQSAQVAPMHVAGGVVVGIEEISVLRVLAAITADPLFENESLKKPRRMGEMPFCRAYVGHRLHDAILGRESPANRRGEISDFVKTREQLRASR